MLFLILNPNFKGGLPLTRLILLSISLLILVVSCSVNGGTSEETVDPTQRWLSAKCPPTEVCGPQTNPETLVIAWLEASHNGLCSVLTKYTSPQSTKIVNDYCGKTLSYKINSIEIKDSLGDIDGKQILKEAIILGDLEFTRNGENHSLQKWSLIVEDIGGKWFVIEGYH